jgi:hypothetical protein
MKLITKIIVFSGIALISLFFSIFSNVHEMQHSDSLMLSLMSLDQPDLFYWGQDRYLTILPLLASVFQNPQVNLIVITALEHLALVASIFLFMILFAEEIWLAASLFSLFLLNIMATQHMIFELLYQPYALSLFLSLTSIYLLQLKKSYYPAFPLLSGVFFALAFETAQIILPLHFVFLLISFIKHKIAKHDLFFHALAFVPLMIALEMWKLLLVTQYIIKPTPTQFVYDITWFKNALTWFFYNADRNPTFQMIQFRNLTWKLPVFAFLFSIISWFGTKQKMKDRPVLALLYLGAAGSMILVSLARWTGYNWFGARYILLSVLIFIFIVSISLARWIPLTVFSSSSQKILLSILVLFPASIEFHLIPVSPLNQLLTFHQGRISLQQECNFYSGSYWKTWNRVWMARAQFNKPVFGISFRSENTLRHIKFTEDSVVCIPPGDRLAARNFMKRYTPGIPLSRPERSAGGTQFVLLTDYQFDPAKMPQVADISRGKVKP